jgi:hypothetical protein
MTAQKCVICARAFSPAEDVDADAAYESLKASLSLHYGTHRSDLKQFILHRVSTRYFFLKG